MQTATIVLGMVALGCLIVAPIFFHLGFTVRLIVCVIGGIVSCYATWLIYHGKVSEFPIYSITIFMSLAAAVFVFSSGGISSTASIWLICTPLIAGSIGGWKLGVILLMLSFAEGVVLVLLEINFGKPVDPTPVEYQFAFGLFRQASQFLVISVALISLWRQEQSADRALLVRIKQLDNEMEARIEAEAMADNANKTKSRFLADMSHEIRTPMNGVLGVLEILSREPLTASQAEFVDLGLDSSKSLLRVINDILDISKIEAGKMELRLKAFDLTAMLWQFEQSVAFEASKKRLNFVLKTSLPNSEVIGDEERIKQILHNLVSNGIKFTQEGAVTLTVDMTTTMVMGHKGYFRFEVLDTGIGIPAEKQSALFKPFSQIENSSTKRHAGTGLGLSISSHLTKLMGGEIEHRQPENGGSCFVVKIPLSFERQVDLTLENEIEGSVSPLQSISSDTRILIVDDSRTNIEILKIMLREYDVHLDTAETGIEALDLIETAEARYDLILMDCQMPEMDGYEATRLIRETYSAKALPIIAVTANAMAGDRDKCLDAGMNDHLPKPVDPDQLISTILQWVD